MQELVGLIERQFARKKGGTELWGVTQPAGLLEKCDGVGVEHMEPVAQPCGWSAGTINHVRVGAVPGEDRVEQVDPADLHRVPQVLHRIAGVSRTELGCRIHARDEHVDIGCSEKPLGFIADIGRVHAASIANVCLYYMHWNG